MLTQAVESYIAVRRATGFAFRSEGSLLQSFAAFSDAAGKRYVSAETAIEWAGSAPSLCSTSAPTWTGDSICAVHSCGRSHTTKYRPQSLAVRAGRDRSPTSFPRTKSSVSSRPHLSWVNATPFAGTPTTRSSPCWRAPGFACRKQSISVFRTSPQTAWSFAVQSSAKAGSFPFTRPHRLAWNSTSCGGAPIPHWMITCSFPCGGARCCCMTPKPHSTTSSRRSASLVERGFRAPRSIPLRHTFAVRALETCPDGRIESQSTCWRCLRTSATARSPTRTGIWRQHRI